MKCDADIRKNYVHVKLSGGTTVFQWICEHMTKELTTLAPSTRKIKDVLPDGDIHCRAEMCFLRESVVPAKFHW